MSKLGPEFAAFLGLLAGLVSTMFIGCLARYILAMRASLQKRRWVVTLLTVLHPSGLFLVALLAAAIHFVWVRKSTDAACFFGALFGTVVLMWSMTAYTISKQRAKRVTPPGAHERA